MMKNYNDVGVYQTADGTWGYRFKVQVNGKTVEKKRLTDEDGNRFKTKTAAAKARKRAIQQAEAQVEETMPLPVRKTVSEIFAEYCEKGRSDRAYNTIKKQDSLWKNHLQEAFGDRFIDDIETAEIVDYLSRLYYEKELAFRYVESFLKMFYLIFGQAYSRGYLSVERYNRLCVNKDNTVMARIFFYKGTATCYDFGVAEEYDVNLGEVWIDPVAIESRAAQWHRCTKGRYLAMKA